MGLTYSPAAQVITGQKGKATLVGGTVTVANTAVQAGSQIVLSHQTPGGTIGLLSVGTIVPGTSFVINSLNPLDTSVVSWVLLT